MIRHNLGHSNSRGYAFVYYESVEAAKTAKEAMSDQNLNGRRIGVEFAKMPHAPTKKIS